MGLTDFDPERKERELRAEADSWDTTRPVDADPGDIPIIDVGEYFARGGSGALAEAAGRLAVASERVGFYQLVGHGVDTELITSVFAATRRFHDLPLDVKMRIRMDRPDWPLGGVGYLPVGERKLPRRAKGNLNEAFLMKRDRHIGADDNQWLPDDVLPGFRRTVLGYADAVEALALRLLPIYAMALGVEPDFFEPGFRHPFWRLRLTHYPPDDTVRTADDEFGIAPHVDTTFFTLLLQDAPGLVIYSAERGCWIRAPLIDGAFVVNSGELLRQWTNDRFLSTRHFANTSATESRYSIPFFFNATADYPMVCVPTCCDEDNPPRYPPISYAESQAVAQGE